MTSRSSPTIARRTAETLLFSATYPPGIVKLSQQFLNKPREIKLAETHGASKIRQRFYEVEDGDRLQAVGPPARPLPACQHARLLQYQGRVAAICVELLRAQGFEALALHGDLEQRDRDQVLVQFANRSCSVLVATDVAARGLDIAQLEAVINVDVTPDPEVHVHRIGRTGRADAEGWALQPGQHG